LSAGKDKKETFERLIRERRIGYLALLRNLRNMEEAGVERSLITNALVAGAPKSRALPFQFVAAWRFAPAFAAAIDTAMIRALGQSERLNGTTAIIVDVSGSMNALLSAKSKLNRIDAAGALAVLCREVSDDCRVFTFSEAAVEVPVSRGIALVEAIHRSQQHSGTYLAAAVTRIGSVLGRDVARVFVITDEQSHDGGVPALLGPRCYLVNVAPYQPGLSVSGGWTRINGFSERLVDYARWNEQGLQELQ